MLVLELSVYSFLSLLLQAYCESWGFCPSQHLACQWCRCKSQVIHWDCKFLFFQSKLIAISFFSLWSIQTILKHDPYILSGHLTSLLYYVTCSSVIILCDLFICYYIMWLVHLLQVEADGTELQFLRKMGQHYVMSYELDTSFAFSNEILDIMPILKIDGHGRYFFWIRKLQTWFLLQF